ncbi:uncharacterized protein LOC115214825 isoform X3 [Octopus sinensis]|uniref:Uncharacterized protein LOC115214825 isoform X3 n=1 Tax=Octopus sinensis TaxID=2607531 RepID=A0A7E6F0F0_9MOLL|nr:uncharacterized protein LOC115214825 isoform X3 [Octopus sinensis]
MSVLLCMYIGLIIPIFGKQFYEGHRSNSFNSSASFPSHLKFKDGYHQDRVFATYIKPRTDSTRTSPTKRVRRKRMTISTSKITLSLKLRNRTLTIPEHAKHSISRYPVSNIRSSPLSSSSLLSWQPQSPTLSSSLLTAQLLFTPPSTTSSIPTNNSNYSLTSLSSTSSPSRSQLSFHLSTEKTKLKLSQTFNRSFTNDLELVYPIIRNKKSTMSKATFTAEDRLPSELRQSNSNESFIYSNNSKMPSRINISMITTTLPNNSTVSYNSSELKTTTNKTAEEPIQRETTGLINNINTDVALAHSQTSCRMKLTTNEGVIVNRGYPYAYASFESCEWKVQISRDFRIKVIFEDLDLEFNKDVLEITFVDESKRFFRRYTGRKLPPPMVLDTDHLAFVFRSDSKGYGRGFYIRFEQTHQEASVHLLPNPFCHELLTSSEGSLSTPGYPFWHYSNSEFCSWVIAAPANSVILLEITGFQTEIYDQLSIGIGLDAANNSSTELLKLYGLLDTPQNTTIPANAIWIDFRSDETITAPGFRINYKIIERKICTFEIEAGTSVGFIQSENYPQPYPLNSECQWIIYTPNGSNLVLDLHDFDLQDGHDFLLIGPGRNAFVENFHKFTGKGGLVKLSMNATSMWLHFTSDHISGERGYRGFNLTYIVENEETASNVEPGNYHRGDIGFMVTLNQTNIPEDHQLIAIKINSSTDNAHLVIRLMNLTSLKVKNVFRQLPMNLNHLYRKFCATVTKLQCNTIYDNIDILSLTDIADHTEISFVVRPRISNISATINREFQSFLNREPQLKSLILKNIQTDPENEAVNTNLPSRIIIIIVSVVFFGVFIMLMLSYSMLRKKAKSQLINTTPFQRRQPKSILAEENFNIPEINGTSFVKTEENWEEEKATVFEVNDTSSKPSSSEFNSYTMCNSKPSRSFQGKEIHCEMMTCKIHRERPNCKTFLCMNSDDSKIKTTIEGTIPVSSERHSLEQ